MTHTKRESLIISKLNKQLNICNISSHEHLLSLLFYKKVSDNASKFYIELKNKYPNIYIEIRDLCIKKYGKPKTKKEFVTSELEKYGNKTKSKGIKKALLRKFKIR